MASGALPDYRRWLAQIFPIVSQKPISTINLLVRECRRLHRLIVIREVRLQDQIADESNPLMLKVHHFAAEKPGIDHRN